MVIRIILVFLLAGCSVIGPPPTVQMSQEQKEEPASAGVVYTDMDKEYIEFDDGDTFDYKGRTIRLMGVDTPETIHEEHGIFQNQEKGPEASAFTKKVITEAGKIQYVPYGQDRYGRLLAHILVDDELLSVRIIKAGLGYETISYYGDYGFKEFAKRILDAWASSPKPEFQDPRIWRRLNQKKGG